MIDRPDVENQGLFGQTSFATIKNVRLEGPLMSIRGDIDVGGLIGEPYYNVIEGIVIDGDIHADRYAGGIIGRCIGSSITGSFVKGNIEANLYAGGIAGVVDENATLTAGYSMAHVRAEFDEAGGFFGRDFARAEINASYVAGPIESLGKKMPFIGTAGGAINASYWATDITGIQSNDRGVGATRSELSCPTQAYDNVCADNTLFEGWSDYVDDNGLPFWDFGSDEQLPALRINGVIHRDSDEDGIFDQNDGFPDSFAAYVDDDQDGLPDIWNDQCDLQCQQSSGLTLDELLNDTDNDGQNNDLDLDDDNDDVEDIDDALPLDPSEIFDIDGDGIGDSADSDDDGDDVADSDDAFPLDSSSTSGNSGGGVLICSFCLCLCRF